MRDADELIEEYSVPKNLQGCFRQAVHFVTEASNIAVNEKVQQLAKEQGAVTLSSKQVEELNERTLQLLPEEISGCFGSEIITSSIMDAFKSLDPDVQKEIIIECLKAATGDMCTFPELEA